jgi:hypothetical protein
VAQQAFQALKGADRDGDRAAHAGAFLAGARRPVHPLYPVKTLLGVIADPAVPDSEIDAFVAAYVTPAADEGEEEQGPKYEFAETAAGNLRYAKRGDGDETIILIHGFGGDLDNWLFNIDALGEKATVYALDLPGHGQSSKKLDNPGLSLADFGGRGLHGQAGHRQRPFRGPLDGRRHLDADWRWTMPRR